MSNDDLLASRQTQLFGGLLGNHNYSLLITHYSLLITHYSLLNLNNQFPVLYR